MTKRGVSAVEVLLATAVVAGALVVVMGLSQSHARQAWAAEYHLQAQLRAGALLGSLAVRDPASLEAAVKPGGLSDDGAEVAVPAALLSDRVVLEWVPAPANPPGRALAQLDAAPARGALFTGAAYLSRARGGPAGTLLWRLRATVGWSFPGDAQAHSYEIERLLARPGLAHQLRPALPGGAR